MYNGGKRHDLGERPICPVCNVNVCGFAGGFSKVDGRPYFSKKCATCSGKLHKRKKYYAAIQRKLKTMTCERCGFKAEHAVQLDVDHIDGDHSNNAPDNHMILCANCHRLKTKLDKKKKKE